MSPASAISPIPRTPSPPDGVRQVVVPNTARALSTLSRRDYEDAFVVQTGPAEHRTGEQWARAVLEDAPPLMRRALQTGWLALGLELGSTRPDRLVLGWELRRSDPEFALLAASSPIGLQGEVLFKRRKRTLLFATFVQQDNPVARGVWAGVALGHRQVVQQLLVQAARREKCRQ